MMWIYLEEAPTSYDQLIDYSIVVEPHNQTWLFALATPVRVDGTGMSIKLRSQGLFRPTALYFSAHNIKVVSARHLIYPPEAASQLKNSRLI